MQPKMTLNRAVIYAVLILFALYFLFPIYVMLSTSFKDHVVQGPRPTSHGQPCLRRLPTGPSRPG
ncbi:MAG: ABC transporter, permease protein 2 (cluster 1, maltose/g3p/polyamine/iron) [uncultured Caballeronia sp.]|nr:MAG: ABC transporter, permease protein 2 (cluster 1, maltose/g3p/polyamine/iron) [uncultured Caballeronia sp.]